MRIREPTESPAGSGSDRLSRVLGPYGAPRTFLTSRRAAPAYRLTNLINKFINNVGGPIDRDPAMLDRLKALSLRDCCVSLAATPRRS